MSNISILPTGKLQYIIVFWSKNASTLNLIANKEPLTSNFEVYLTWWTGDAFRLIEHWKCAWNMLTLQEL